VATGPKLDVPRVHDDDGLDPDDVDQPIVDAKCDDCRLTAPPTRSAHTLISARHGWRVTRSELLNGSFSLTWFCPDCWKRRSTVR